MLISNRMLCLILTHFWLWQCKKLFKAITVTVRITAPFYALSSQNVPDISTIFYQVLRAHTFKCVTSY